MQQKSEKEAGPDKRRGAEGAKLRRVKKDNGPRPGFAFLCGFAFIRDTINRFVL